VKSLSTITEVGKTRKPDRNKLKKKLNSYFSKVWPEAVEEDKIFDHWAIIACDQSISSMCEQNVR
jgi:hypothetical protein